MTKQHLLEVIADNILCREDGGIRVFNKTTIFASIDEYTDQQVHKLRSGLEIIQEIAHKSGTFGTHEHNIQQIQSIAKEALVTPI